MAYGNGKNAQLSIFEEEQEWLDQRMEQVNQEMQEWLDEKLKESILAGNKTRVEQCIVMRANINKIDEDTKFSPLMTACEIGNIDIAKALIGAKADVNFQTEGNKNTALMIAAMYGRMNIVSLLLNHGADPMLKNRFEHTALHYSQKYHHPKTSTILREAEKAAQKNK
jgi:ankyrin repeat protein